MRTPTNTRESSNQHQVGAVLPIALIFLVILTIIGVTAMNTSVLDTLMATNTQFEFRALSDAENILITGEEDTEVIANAPVLMDFNIPNDHYYDATISSTDAIDPSIWDWDGSDNVFGTADDLFITAPDANGGHYVIEYGGKEELPKISGSIAISTGYPGSAGGGAGGFVNVFLVTTQADSSRGARRIVQSVYVVLDDE